VISKRLTSRRTHSTNTTWGSLKSGLQRSPYVIQDSQIGDWELAIKNLDRSNDGEEVHKTTHPLGSR
jgi:hypothetical protein